MTSSSSFFTVALAASESAESVALVGAFILINGFGLLGRLLGRRLGGRGRLGRRSRVQKMPQPRRRTTMSKISNKCHGTDAGVDDTRIEPVVLRSTSIRRVRDWSRHGHSPAAYGRDRYRDDHDSRPGAASHAGPNAAQAHHGSDSHAGQSEAPKSADRKAAIGNGGAASPAWYRRRHIHRGNVPAETPR